MCVMNFVSYRGIAFILIGSSAIQQVCFFDVNLCVPVHLLALKLIYIRNVTVAKTLRGNSVVEFRCTIKTFKVFTEEAT